LFHDKDNIPGLSQVFSSEVPKGSVILVTGTAGTLKSAFAYEILSKYLMKQKDEYGIYTTLEETKESHIRNMESLGIKLNKRLMVSDIASFRRHIDYEKMDFLDLIVSRINKGSVITSKKRDQNSKSAQGENKNKEYKLSCFVLDSLNALYSLLEHEMDGKKLRNKMLQFFDMLRQKNLVSFLILELPRNEPYSYEFFLGDGIIEFGIEYIDGFYKRYFQVKKMRATRHKLEPHVLEVDEEKGGLKVIGELIVQSNH
jgi:KaiC/GvpD/RAD55 family RecA-like ATPase